MTLEIETTRGLAAQILRHRSFTYQEFSQRYADSSLLGETIPLPELRRQDTKNRQNSIDDIDPFTVQKYQMLMQDHFKDAMDLYQKMLERFLESDHLQEAEQVEEAKRELASLREQIEQVEKDNYKGFGKK